MYGLYSLWWRILLTRLSSRFPTKYCIRNIYDDGISVSLPASSQTNSQSYVIIPFHILNRRKIMHLAKGNSNSNLFGYEFLRSWDQKYWWLLKKEFDGIRRHNNQGIDSIGLWPSQFFFCNGGKLIHINSIGICIEYAQLIMRYEFQKMGLGSVQPLCNYCDNGW